MGKGVLCLQHDAEEDSSRETLMSWKWAVVSAIAGWRVSFVASVAKFFARLSYCWRPRQPRCSRARCPSSRRRKKRCCWKGCWCWSWRGHWGYYDDYCSKWSGLREIVDGEKEVAVEAEIETVGYCSCQFCRRLPLLLPPHQPPIVAVVEAVMQIEPATVSTLRPNSLLCLSQQPLCPLRPTLVSRIPFQHLWIIAEDAFLRVNQQYLTERLWSSVSLLSQNRGQLWWCNYMYSITGNIFGSISSIFFPMVPPFWAMLLASTHFDFRTTDPFAGFHANVYPDKSPSSRGRKSLQQ